MNVEQALELVREVFLASDVQSENCEKLMAAAFLGGTAIANSMVGVVHRSLPGSVSSAAHITVRQTVSHYRR